MLRDWQDAYGHEIYDYLKGKGGYEIVERDDGFFDVSSGPEIYFSEYEEWKDHERAAIKRVKGKVLDIGCGAGRHALYLQSKGHEVVGIDISPLAIKVCKERGVKRTEILSITQISSKLGKFDTIIMMGNNFGLFGSFKRARWLLRRFKSITTERAMIIAETRDPYQTDLPEHLEYHELNRKRGRMPGQLRIRIRYKKYVTPWFDYLLVSKDEMKAILQGTGWQVEEFIDGKDGMYIAVMEKVHLPGRVYNRNDQSSPN